MKTFNFFLESKDEAGVKIKKYMTFETKNLGYIIIYIGVCRIAFSSHSYKF